MKNLFVLIFLFFVFSCAHIPKISEKKFSELERNDIYAVMAKEIEKINGKNLKECNCMKAFYRDFYEKPDKSARYLFDKKIVEHVLKKTAHKSTVDILAFGSGQLLSELAVFANLIKEGKNLNIYLYDYVYLFYGEENYKTKALDLAKNPEKIPDGWKNYLLDHIVWDYIKKHPRTFSKMFDEVHAAIDEFKGVIAALSAKYQTKTKVHILKKPQDGKLELPYLDSIIAIDAYTTIPNLVWNFEYNLSPLKAPAQFMALNKISPQGVFYEPVSNEPVNISVYDIVHSTTGNYRLSLIEEQRIKPTQAQEAKVPEKDYVRNIFGN